MPKAPSRRQRSKNVFPTESKETAFPVSVIDIYVDGVSKPYSLDVSRMPATAQMHREIIPAIESGFGPQGGWRAPSTLHHVRTHAAHILAFAHERRVTSFSEFTPQLWDEYLSLGNNQRITIVRALMQRVSVLPMDTQARIRRRFSKIKPVDAVTHTNPPAAVAAPASPELRGPEYSRAELSAIENAAQRVLSQGARRIEQHQALVQSDAQTQLANSLRSMLQGGPIPTSYAALPNTPKDVKTATFHWVMPTREEAVAFAALMVIKEGYNLSTVERMRMPRTSASIGDADGIILLETDKPRRGQSRRHAQNVLEASTEGAAGSVVKRWLNMTQAVHQFLIAHETPTASLFLYASLSPCRGGPNSLFAQHLHVPIRVGLPTGSRPSWSKPWWLQGLNLNFQKLHRSALAVLNRGALHNTRSTYITDYLAKSPTALQTAHQSSLKAQEYALARANERIQLPLLESNSIPDGASDTATVSCRNYDCHPETKERCTDSFLACLTCPNAVAAPMHLPRLCYLREALDNRRSMTDSRDWNRWSEHFWNLEAFLRNVAGLSDQQIKSQASMASRIEQEHVRRVLGGTYDAA